MAEEAKKESASGAAVAAAVAGGEAPDGAIDPRAYWWWQCQHICNPKEYQKVLKAKLITLYTAVDEHLQKGGAPAEPMRALLKHIFRDKTTTLKSYNLKALQCTILLTEYSLSLTEDYNVYLRRSQLPGPGQAIGRELKAIYSAPAGAKGGKLWHDMAALEGMIRSNKESIFLPLLVEEDSGAGGGGCCPVKPGVAIATPLGTMTFMELLESLNQDIYLIGVVMDFTMADGYDYSPFEFFAHDLFHLKARLGNRPAAAARIQKNVANFLAFLRTVPEERDRYLAEMILFMIQHEAYNDSMLEAWTPGTPLPSPIGRGLGVAWDPTSWTTPRYGPLIPEWAMPASKRTDPIAVLGFLNMAAKKFQELWDAAVAVNPSGDAAVAANPSGEAPPTFAAGPNFSAQANRNASAWNEETFAGGRRLKKTLHRRNCTRVQGTRRRRCRRSRRRIR